ncbi:MULTISPECIES: hypothetical protein [unclassified Streptomyces]|uniref:hypothetical protein n=1 Tax=unclassified Streptomyces TaxID=2593676 RepID=UPI003D93B986
MSETTERTAGDGTGTAWEPRGFTPRYRAAWAVLIDHLAGADNKTPCEPCNAYEQCATGAELRVEMHAARAEMRAERAAAQQ